MQRLTHTALHISLTLTLTGCGLLAPEEPPPEDLDAGHDCPDQGHDAGGDAGEGDDVGDGPDADGPAPNACVGEYATTSTIDPEQGVFSQTWVMTCDREPGADEFGEVVLLERTDGGGIQEVSFGGLSCRPGEPDGVVCELTLDGITARTPDAGGVLGEVDFIAYAANPGAKKRIRQNAVRRLRHRYRLSSTRVADAQEPRDLTALPAGYAARGITTARPLETSAGRVVVGAMRSEDGAQIELFSVSPDGSTRVIKNQLADGFEADASGLSVARVDGGLGVVWWRHDRSTATLSGVLATLGADGAPVEVDELDPTTYTGPQIASIHGVEVGRTQVGRQTRLTARALARTDQGTLALVRLGDADGATRLSVALQADALDGLPASTLEPGTFGLLSTDDVDAELADRPAVAWVARPDGTVTAVGLTDPTLRAQVNTGADDFDWDALEIDGYSAAERAELSDSYGSTSARYVPTESGAEERVFLLGVNADGLFDGTATELAPPDFGFDSCGFVVEDLQIAFTSCAHPALGGAPVTVRWDLSRRDAQERAPVTYVGPITPGRRGARAGRGDRVVSWINTDDTLETSGDDLFCGDTDHLRLGEEGQGARGCAAPVGAFTPGGYRINALPGETGLTWAVDKYGDILIDGVPLVFDLIAPPIVFDTPGAQGFEAMILATIDHPEATHAVWRVGADGALSEPGLLDMRRASQGAGRQTYVSAHADIGDTGGVLTTNVCHFSVAPGDGPPTVVTAAVDVLAAAIGSPEPVSIETRVTEGLPQAPASIAVLAPAGLAPEASALEPLAEGASLLATLTPEQARRPLLVTRTGETVTVWAQGADGALTEVATVEGAGGVVSSNQSVAIFPPGWTGRIKRISIKKRRVGSNFRVGSTSRSEDASNNSTDRPTEEFSLNFELLLTSYGPSQPGAYDPGVLTELGDFNGDGLEDVLVTPDGAPPTVYFDDGAGASLPEPLAIPGGPTVTWPPVVRATAGNGKGTRKASSQTQQQHIPLL
jgi:predicted small lipoprotein YifL